MSCTIIYKGIVWTVTGFKDGKGILSHGTCSVIWNKSMGVFIFYHGQNFLLARELRSDCIRDATECLLDAYASQFVPSWESHVEATQETQVR